METQRTRHRSTARRTDLQHGNGEYWNCLVKVHDCTCDSISCMTGSDAYVTRAHVAPRGYTTRA